MKLAVTQLVYGKFSFIKAIKGLTSTAGDAMNTLCDAQTQTQTGAGVRVGFKT